VDEVLSVREYAEIWLAEHGWITTSKLVWYSGCSMPQASCALSRMRSSGRARFGQRDGETVTVAARGAA
jgi:hypothetical protein